MGRFTDWLLAELRVPEAAHGQHEHTHPWWRVMCLTGVDYFSSLGYAPGISFLAAGLLSPLATLVLVLVTLFAALPAYNRVAEASPNGQGSIAMLERLFPKWNGKFFVLILLGFAATDFIITITLSAADGAAHLIQNPFVPRGFGSQMAVTIGILIILGAIFLRGFKEAINIATVLVGVYLVLNAVVAVVTIAAVFANPGIISAWGSTLRHQVPNPWSMLGIALLLFPRLALGLSGFETGVAVMPLIEAKDIAERIRNTRRLLLTAAVIMSCFLMTSSVATTLLIPAKEFEKGGSANGRAVAWLAHKYFGNGFGTLYDFSTILILGFAGASAMAGLLNLVPRYLPRYGMAPEWARASRPLVFVFFGISLLVTLVFRADVDAQGGAYATGVLVLMTSAAIAVAINAKGWTAWLFRAIALVFVYTTGTNMLERPEGIKVASVFIASILFTSFLSRVQRATELRTNAITFNDVALDFLKRDPDHIIRLIAHKPKPGVQPDYEDAECCIRELFNLPADENLIVLEVVPGDASDFDAPLEIRGECEGSHQILRTESLAVPNAIAAILIEITRRTGCRAHVYFTWAEGNPVFRVLQFLFFGDGYVAPVTHEVLRRAIKDRDKRPLVHVV